MKFFFSKQRPDIKKIIWSIGEHVFVFTLALVGIAFVISASLFSVYVLPSQTKTVLPPESTLKFRKDIFGQVVQNWSIQEQKFREATNLAPQSIFRYNPPALRESP